MNKRNYPTDKFNTLLQSGETVLVTTRNGDRNNIMAVAWQTPLDFKPALTLCVINSDSLTYENLLETGECVINIPTGELAAQTLGCGSSTGRETDKFRKFGLTPVRGETVKAPLIDECYANLECRLHDSSMVKKYDLFILEVLKVWIDESVKVPRTLHHISGDEFFVPGEKIHG